MTVISELNIQRKSCVHESKDLITSTNHEICCRKCGTVLDIDNEQEYEATHTANLFQEVQPGSKPVKIESTKRVHEQKYTSSAFSNACDKLRLPRHVAIDAYRTFIKIHKIKMKRKKTINRKLTETNKYKINNLSKKSTQNSNSIEYAITNSIQISNFEIAMYSLFVAIRRFGILKSIAEIEDAIKFAFSIKRTVSIIRVFSVIKPIAQELGIDYDKENHLEYWINIYLRKTQNKTNFLTNEIKNEVRKIALNTIGTDEFRARFAVKIILTKLGIKNV